MEKNSTNSGGSSINKGLLGPAFAKLSAGEGRILKVG
jgi:hypothetical protein